MRVVTADDIQKIRDLANPEGPDDNPLECDLMGYAAQSAILYMSQNWDEARMSAQYAKDFSTESILHDVDELVHQLRAFRARAAEILQ